MPEVFEALPGIEVPVGSLSRRLAEMWRQPAEHGTTGAAGDDATATQVNFVLHLGLKTTPEDGAAQFATAIEFSKRYPSRVVVLCPRATGGAAAMRAKVYGECHLGKSRSDKRCVEFAIISYPKDAPEHLENQVSICLSADLPLYYWVHAFADCGRIADYRYLLTGSKRVLIDRARSPEGALEYPWPRPESVRDLTHARLLPVRQTLGQFLSRYPAAAIAAGLSTVSVSHSALHAAEGTVLLAWLRDRIEKCGGDRAQFRTAGDAPSGHLGVRFGYSDSAKSFAWRGDLGTGRAHFTACLGAGSTELDAPVSLLPPAATLSEAMFF